MVEVKLPSRCYAAFPSIPVVVYYISIQNNVDWPDPAA